jgi:hypothetical protein
MPHYLLLTALRPQPDPSRARTCRRCGITFGPGVEQLFTTLILVREDDLRQRAVQVPLCSGCGQPAWGLNAAQLASDQLTPNGGVLQAAAFFPQAFRWNQVLEQLHEEAQALKEETLTWTRNYLAVWFPNLDEVAAEIEAEWAAARQKPAPGGTPRG